MRLEPSRPVSLPILRDARSAGPQDEEECFARSQFQTAKRLSFVMPGLDPGIHPLAKTLDCRIKSGNDEVMHHRPVFGSGSGAPVSFLMPRIRGSGAPTGAFNKSTPR